jgi:hypothetical protein
METSETQDAGGKEVRGGRPPRTVAIIVNLTMADYDTVGKLGSKRMRQTGEDITRDRVISEALQLYAKSLSAAE